MTMNSFWSRMEKGTLATKFIPRIFYTGYPHIRQQVSTVKLSPGRKGEKLVFQQKRFLFFFIPGQYKRVF